MENIKDTYYTIASACGETLHKDRGSKFYGYAFPVTTEQDIKACIDKLKKATSHRASFLLCMATGRKLSKIQSQ
jgi:putative IMPACT (imprinted ancient) family translation regulator